MGALSFSQSSPIGYQDLFSQWADKTDNGMMVVGARRQVLLLNQPARDILRFAGELPFSLKEVVRDVDVEFAVGDAFHDRKPVRYEAYTPHPDRLLEYHMVPITAPTGEPILVVVSINDRTRLRHLETIRRDFVANVSHELRTPITSINLLVETLQTGAMEDPEAANHFLQRIQVETLSMMRLVEELLELSRLESGRLALQLEAMDVHESLQHVVDRLALVANDKQIDMQIDVRTPLPAVMGDSERLEQVLMNLVHNAIKFTPDGGAVTVRASRQGLAVQIEVIDTGVGMDAADAARIFERFYKVDKGRNRGAGTGLGLAVARHIIELHGSRLHVVSEPGRGSRFFFSLPIAR